MAQLLFDLETNGLLAEATTIHCAVILDLDTQQVTAYPPDEVGTALARLADADLLAGFNIVGFDVPVIKKLYPGWCTSAKMLDHKWCSRVLYPGGSMDSILKRKDFAMRRKYGNTAIPAKLMGWHSLEAWGYRLRMHKAEYTQGWETYTPEMLAYCRRDVEVNLAFHNHCMKRGSLDLFLLESEVAANLFEQEKFGIGFDHQAAVSVMAELSERRGVLDRELRVLFPPILVAAGHTVSPKRTAQSMLLKPGEVHYRNVREGCEYRKIKLQEFNPAAPGQVGDRLQRVYGWEPQAFGKDGKATLSDDILRDLPYAPCKKLAEYQIVKKVLGFIANGKNAWLKLEQDGRLHPRVNATGAVTHRASHHEPNVAQVPKTGKPYGTECRSMFKAGGGSVPESWVMVGCDAASLQLALYSHYVALYDNGVFAKLVETGKAHDKMQAQTGLHYRDNQKTFTYAKWFGAGDYKLGTIVLDDWQQALDGGLIVEPLPSLKQAASLGKRAQQRLASRMTGYRQLEKALAKAGQAKCIKSFDGRTIPVMSARLALMALLQGGEAVIMKHAYVDACRELREVFDSGDYGFMLWVHDEFQVGCRPEVAPAVGEILQRSITSMTQRFKLRVQLGADFKIGKSWAETH